MNISNINGSFEHFHNEFKNYKDAGVSEQEFLALYIKRMDEKERKIFFDYCLKESNILASLDLLIKVNEKSVINPLFVIFKEYYRTQNIEAKNLLTALFILRDDNPSHLNFYNEFIRENVEEDISWDNFNLIGNYIYVNKENAIAILSRYYCNLSSDDKKIVSFLESRIIFLMHLFEETSFEYMKELILKTSDRNSEAGGLLKKLFCNYAKSDFCSKKKEEKILGYLESL